MGLPIVTTNIVLRTRNITRAGFGTPIFISSLRNFSERVRTYKSIEEVKQDFSEDDNAYQAALSFTANTPSPSQFKIGRREADPVFIPKEPIETGDVFSISLTAEGDSLTINYTALSGDTASDVTAGLVADIPPSDPILDNLSIVDGSGTVTVTSTSSSVVYTLDDREGLSVSYTSSETASEVLSEVSAEDDDFYFITADDHTSTFVEDLAIEVESLKKMYFVSSQEQGSLGTYSTSVADVLGLLKTGNYGRTVSMWSQVADTRFPECNFVGVNAPYAPDVRSVVWDGKELAGLPVALNSNNNPISSTAQKNLEDRDASFIVNTAAGARVIGGKTVKGEWIDNAITLDTMTARVTEANESLILNQQGGKVPAGKEGIALVEGAIMKALNPFVSADSIEGYEVFTDDASVDTQTREITGVEFIAYLTGAIVRATINGDLVEQEV